MGRIRSETRNKGKKEKTLACKKFKKYILPGPPGLRVVSTIGKAMVFSSIAICFKVFLKFCS
jgi:hypothetical protein